MPLTSKEYQKLFDDLKKYREFIKNADEEHIIETANNYKEKYQELIECQGNLTNYQEFLREAKIKSTLTEHLNNTLNSISLLIYHIELIED